MDEPTSTRQGGSGTEVADDETQEVTAGEQAAENRPGFVVRDKRRLDPETGEIRAKYSETDPTAQDAAGPGEGAPGPTPPADGGVADAVRVHAAFIAGETLATELTVVPAAEVAAEPQPVGDGGAARVTLAKSAGM